MNEAGTTTANLVAHVAHGRPWLQSCMVACNNNISLRALIALQQMRRRPSPCGPMRALACHQGMRSYSNTITKLGVCLWHDTSISGCALLLNTDAAHTPAHGLDACALQGTMCDVLTRDTINSQCSPTLDKCPNLPRHQAETHAVLQKQMPTVCWFETVARGVFRQGQHFNTWLDTLHPPLTGCCQGVAEWLPIQARQAVHRQARSLGHHPKRPSPT